MSNQPANRNAQLAQIHMARAALEKTHGLTEDAYRDLMAAKFGGKRSAAELSAQQRAELLHHFQRLGWVGRVGGSQANSPSKAGAKRPSWSGAHKKLYSLWQQLFEAGLVQDRSAKALGAWCKAQTAGQAGQGGVDRLEWLKPAQINALTEMAKQWLARADVHAVAQASISEIAQALQRRNEGGQ